MSHELTQRKDGFVEMAYFGDVPWHSLGNELTLADTLDLNEVKRKAGMDWLVKRSRVRYGEGPTQRTMDDMHVLFRSDTKEPLGVVSSKYNIVQPAECLEFFSDILSANGFRMNTAGTMFGGKRFWAMASIGEGANILGNDHVNGFLLLSTSADGTLATTAKFTTIRVVCNNTLSMALSSKSAADVKISHRTKFDADQAKDRLGIVRGKFGEFIHAAKRLAVTTVAKQQAADMTAKLLVDAKAVTKDDVSDSAGFKSIMRLFQAGKGNHGETAWDWVNGVTEYVDHVQRAKSDSHRMANSMFGKGDALKTLAFERALAIAD